MASRHRVYCINKTDRSSAHEWISHIGGVNDDGTRWRMREEDAIKAIEDKKYEFYVLAGGKSANVIIATHSGRKYLKTESDGYSPDNLLALPECPTS